MLLYLSAFFAVFDVSLYLVWPERLSTSLGSSDVLVGIPGSLIAIGGMLNLVSLLLKVRVINAIDARQAVKYLELDQPDDPQGFMTGHANHG
ncbi:MAG: hypothetical protein ACYC6B_07050 [Thermoleophilia bacterium]